MDSSNIFDIYSTTTGISLNFFADVLIPFLLEVIGAFLGVFGAIWLSRKETREKRKELVRSLKEELTKINNELEERLKYKGNRDYYRYPTQVWDINTRSEILGNLSLQDYRNYIDIYSQIEFAQEIEGEWFHSSLIMGRGTDTVDYIQENYVITLDKKRWELAEDIHKSIKKLLSSNLHN